MSSRSGRGVRFLIRRYLPSELAGIATALVAGGFAYTVSDSLLVAVIAGISSENVGFSAAARVGFLIRRRVHEARRAPIPTSTDDSILDVRVRTARVDGLRQTFADIDLDTLVMLNGTPLLVLDTERLAEQYKRLRAALPFVHWYYAVKAQSHPAVIETLALLGAAFGVSSDCEIDVVAGQGVGSDRIIHTRPVKSPTEITRAYVLGIRTFVVDCAGELAKFRNVPANVSLLIRLDHRNLPAESGLQDTFGASAIEAEVLLSQAIAQGNHIAGFSFHVGSRLNSVDAFVAAMTATLDLMDRLQRQWNVQFTVLDIGGGFPVGHRTDVESIEQIANALRPMLELRAAGVRIIAEPGRVLVADAITLVSRVLGVRDRDREAWCFIDDGVYGSYSTVMTETVHPVIVSRAELDGHASVLVSTTVGGCTGDCADVVARRYPLPRLCEGDLLLSPSMGAYTSVTATPFSGRRPAKLIRLERAAAAQREEAVILATH